MCDSAEKRRLSGVKGKDGAKDVWSAKSGY